MNDDDGEVWEKYSGELVRYATALVGPFDAEDVLSSAFLGATSSTGWPAVANRRAYLFRAVANTASNWRRSGANRTSRERRVAIHEAASSSHEAADVIGLLMCLTVRQRSVVWLSYWLDASSREVAEVLGISVRTVERELRAGRRRLKKELE